MTKKQHFWFWFGLSATFLVCGWFILTQPMFYTHDFLHGARIAEMARGLVQGQWPVIWSENFAWGYGMPLFEFYAPLPYFLGALIHLLGANLVWSVKILFLLTSIISFVGAFLWAREFYEDKLAALSGALFTLASYRAMDMFARGAMSELWAIAALPWIFCGLTRLIKGGKKSILITVSGLVVLILSHNITTLLAAPFFVLYVILLLSVNKKWRWPKLRPLIRKLLIAGCWSFALTAFYLLPALFEQNYTQLKTWILGEYFDYRIHFVYPKQFFWDNFGYGGSGYGLNDGISFFLGYAQWILIFFTSAVTLWAAWSFYRRGWQRTKQIKTKSLFLTHEQLFLSSGWLILLVLSLWLATYRAAAIWRLNASWWQMAQFPWRFLAIAIALVAVLAPLGITFLRSRFLQNWLICFAWLILLISSFSYWRGENILGDASDYYQGSPVYIREQSSFVMVDYLPTNFANTWQAVPENEIVFEQNSLAAAPEILINKMAHKKYLLEASQAARLEFKIADYPLWQVIVNEQEQEASVSAHGNVTAMLEDGKNVVELRLLPTPLRRWANLLSAGAWLAAIGCGVYSLATKKKYGSK
ncbi:MAG: 6-pyruvoyl-tetrahydropterin synthase-related protein [bacterium]|nr:6-pyruvoyl-tetrahydropterin synthase-related protein [bacterium]